MKLAENIQTFILGLQTPWPFHDLFLAELSGGGLEREDLRIERGVRSCTLGPKKDERGASHDR